MTDTAVVAGVGPGFPVPTGTVTFFLCGPSEVDGSGCPAGGDQIGDSVALDDTGSATSAATVPVSQPVTAEELGTYCWRAVYSGDSNYLGSTHTNADSECLTIRSPISGLDKDVRVLPGGTFADTADAIPGDQLEYRLTYTNSGNGPATNTMLTDVVRDRTTFVSCTGCTVTGDGSPGSVITFDLGTVTAGGSVSVTFIVELDAVFPNGETQIKNSATASTDEEDDDTPSDETTTTVRAAPQSSLDKG
ncbi:MAG: Ig-like domain repeat protein, partial [Acidimicrobiia bacterium]|nr:Ig-like domain repeat protein [Acidimicrobiia bacterium]